MPPFWIDRPDCLQHNTPMRTMTIHLKSINEVKEFVRIVNDFNYDVDLISGRYIVDAKSIMGISASFCRDRLRWRSQ